MAFEEQKLICALLCFVAEFLSGKHDTLRQSASFYHIVETSSTDIKSDEVMYFRPSVGIPLLLLLFTFTLPRLLTVLQISYGLHL